jgi:hypothetical protein
MKKLVLAIAIVSLSISSISCTAEELPTQPEQNLELNQTVDNGEGTILPPKKGN